MALAGTDLAHDLRFQHQAEAHRRSLIEALNNEHAYGGSTTGERGWEATAEFYAGLDAFHPAPPGLTEGIQHRIPELISLFFWAVVLLVVLAHGADRLERGRLPC